MRAPVERAAAYPPFGSLICSTIGMARRTRRFSIARATQALQENVTRSGPVAGASYTLIGAIILLGGLGYALDQWQATSPWGTVGGLALGLIVGFYELIKVAWPR